MSKALGDYATSTVIYGKFTTFRPSTGAAFTLGGTPALSVYKDNSTTQSTTGVTLTADFDSVTGLNHFAIDTSADGTFYSAGSNFDIVITTGTVDSVSVVGAVVGSFSLAKTAALRPTTAGRTLDVASTGEAGLDYDNINVSAGPNSALGWIESGTLQSGTASTAVLRSATSFVDDLILGSTIYIRSGTGAGQSRYIYDWVSASDTASVSPDWTTTPDNTSVYAVIPTSPAPTHSSTLPNVNVTQISGDTTAADNAEAFFDGTGYAGTNNVIPTVTTLTNLPAITANWLTAAGTAADFTTEIQSGLATAAELAKVPKSDGTATWNATALASIQAEATDALNAYDPPTNAEMETRTPSAAQLANIVSTGADWINGGRLDLILDDILLDTGTTLPGQIDDIGIKKNTAFSNFEFLMVLASDHVTPATGLTVTGQRSIDGAAFASVAGTIAEVSNGIYQFDAAAADTNGDVITWRFSSATADDAFVTFKTVA